jgi:hypothetical protein
LTAGADFQRAFVAMRYFLGVRGGALGEPLGELLPPAEQLAQRLSHEDRKERALSLAGELAKLAGALKARALR